VIISPTSNQILSFRYSGTVATLHTTSIKRFATTIAHAIGHVLGMEHDERSCICRDKHCIMTPFYSEDIRTHWSSCSVDELNLAFHRGMNHCLKNLPKKLFGSPTCGNGFVEEDEECGKRIYSWLIFMDTIGLPQLKNFQKI